MDIYENIVIGNFLYALGFEMGRAPRGSRGMSVNLLQQTPLDKQMGDVLLMSASLYRLIEFKRVANKSSKERNKRDALLSGFEIVDTKRNALLAGFESRETAGIASLSRQIHWYVETDMRGTWTSRAVPYLDFDTDVQGEDFETFIVSTAAKAAGPALKEQEATCCRAYLTFAASLAACETDSGGDSGCLLIVAGGGQPLQFIAMDSLSDLLAPVGQILERQIARTQAAEARAQYDRGRSIERSRGFEM